MKPTRLLGLGAAFLICSAATPTDAAVLLTHSGGLVSESALVVAAPGTIVRDNTSSGTVYFRFTVTNPASGGLTAENSFAAFELVPTGGGSAVGVGNNWGAWAYSVFGNTGDADLNSATPESGVPYQLIRLTDVTTIAFSVTYNPGGNDTLTAWLNPNFGATPGAQTSNLTTLFSADFSFSSIQLREGGAGNGWNFGNIQVATTPEEIGFAPVPEPSSLLLGGLGLIALRRRRR
jgi:hypothetical protein